MSFLKQALAALEAQHLRRQLRRHDDEPGRSIEIDGNLLVNFSSNNYLGLARHPAIIEASQIALQSGTGSTASRLVTGNLGLHEELEARLARFHGCAGARLFNSGYQANLGLISSLAGPEDLVLSDQLNHASVIDGCRLSRAKILVVEHANPDAYRAMLASAGGYRRRFVVTDSVFSMDGDRAPVRELRALCDQYEAFLIVDEAHAVGTLGPGGAGVCADAGVKPDALVGGLGKGFGSFGGYVVGTDELCEYLLNQARSFVFSTALPPAVVAASLAALTLIESADGAERRQRLMDRIEQLRAGLDAMGSLEPGAGRSPVFPIIVGAAEAAMEASLALIEAGIFCQAIRPPTVERGRARLRIALSALHSAADVDLLLTRLANLPQIQ